MEANVNGTPSAKSLFVSLSGLAIFTNALNDLEIVAFEHNALVPKHIVVSTSSSSSKNGVA
jgi:hypothetical protein